MQTTIDTEISVTLDDRPGALAEATARFGDYDVNILGFQGETADDQGIVRFVADAPAQAVKALEETGATPETREVLLVGTQHEPGELSNIAATLGQSGVNIQSAFPVVTPGGDVSLALDVDDVPSARKVLSG